MQRKSAGLPFRRQRGPCAALFAAATLVAGCAVQPAPDGAAIRDDALQGVAMRGDWAGAVVDGRRHRRLAGQFRRRRSRSAGRGSAAGESGPACGRRPRRAVPGAARGRAGAPAPGDRVVRQRIDQVRQRPGRPERRDPVGVVGTRPLGAVALCAQCRPRRLCVRAGRLRLRAAIARGAGGPDLVHRDPGRIATRPRARTGRGHRQAGGSSRARACP